MQLRFSNYKKVYIILGVFVFLLGVLYIISVIYSRNRSSIKSLQPADNGTNVSITPSMGSTDNKGTSSSGSMTPLQRILLEKTNRLIYSLENNSLDYREDTAFQYVESDLIDGVASNLKFYQFPVSIEVVQINISPNEQSGSVYIRVIGKDYAEGDLLEFIYQKSDKNEWQFTGFMVHVAR